MITSFLYSSSSPAVWVYNPLLSGCIYSILLPWLSFVWLKNALPSLPTLSPSLSLSLSLSLLMQTQSLPCTVSSQRRQHDQHRKWSGRSLVSELCPRPLPLVQRHSLQTDLRQGSWAPHHHWLSAPELGAMAAEQPHSGAVQRYVGIYIIHSFTGHFLEVPYVIMHLIGDHQPGCVLFWVWLYNVYHLLCPTPADFFNTLDRRSGCRITQFRWAIIELEITSFRRYSTIKSGNAIDSLHGGII